MAPVTEQTPALSDELTENVLDFLEVEPAAPDVALLDNLLAAYTRKVPWESIFRIARRASTTDLQACPRWPALFWRDAMERGGGGTCFESNYAFFGLLRRLGFDGYLTINNMEDTVGCHTAIVLHIDGEKWLADVGLPVYTALPIRETEPTQRMSFAHTYRVVPRGRRRFRILRDKHPKEECFRLVDEPVSDTVYRQATTKDYDSSGYFLDRLIITKVVDGIPWRFNGAERPLRLESYEDGERTDHPLGEDAIEALADHFAMDAGVLAQAFAALEERVA